MSNRADAITWLFERGMNREAIARALKVSFSTAECYVYEKGWRAAELAEQMTPAPSHWQRPQVARRMRYWAARGAYSVDLARVYGGWYSIWALDNRARSPLQRKRVRKERERRLTMVARRKFGLCDE